MRTKKGARLGQHFLKHGWAAAKLAHAVPLLDGETFIEIGPGKGVLTRELLELGPVVAVEKDPALIFILRERFSGEIASGKLRLVEKDVRDFDPASCNLQAARYVVAANIPYYITGEIIRQFLTSERQPRAMALLVQKEVADRIVARDGKESILSLSVKAYGTPRIIAKVGKSHFSPPPKVDSAILVIDGISKRVFADVKEAAFFALLHRGFASKRKMLRGNLDATQGFDLCGISDTARPEDITLEQWTCLCRALM